jgi:epoxide hydrolase-like predicted phosphatase
MVVRAVVFDIGGVLELTPDLGTDEKWQRRFALPGNEYKTRTHPIWRAGGLGQLTLDQVHEQLGTALETDQATVAQFMADIWTEYLGTLNTELRDWFAALRPRWRTGILSNSFVGAREREAAAYGFPDLVDELIYSHEVGLAKPDPAVYQLTCDRLGVRPDELAYVDDVRVCVDAARELGIHAILFESNTQVITTLESLLAT